MNLNYLHERLDWLEPHWQLAQAFTPRPVFDRLQVVAAFRAELWDLILIRDDQVLLRRLQWWLEEWERMTACTARHPLTQALQELEQIRQPDLRAALTAMVSWRMGQDSTPPDCFRSAASLLASFESTDDGTDAWHSVLIMDLARRVDRLHDLGCSLLSVSAAAALQLRNEDLLKPASYAHWAGELIDRHFVPPQAPRSFAWIFADLGRSAVMGRNALGRTLSVWRMRRRIRYDDA